MNGCDDPKEGALKQEVKFITRAYDVKLIDWNQSKLKFVLNKEPFLFGRKRLWWG